MTNEQIIQSYVQLLIIQYTGQTNVQTMTFSQVPVSGTYQITYGTLISAPLAYNEGDIQIADAISKLTGVASVSVSSVTSTSNQKVITVVFGVPAVPPMLILGMVGSSLIDANTNTVTNVTSGTLLKAAMMIQALSKLNVMNQLPIQIQNGFNLIPTVQTITFAAALTTGSFVLTFSVTSSPTQNATSTAAINYNDSNVTIQNKINAILPSGLCTVTGELGAGSISVSFQGVNPSLVMVGSNTTGQAAVITSNIAQGTQLDTLGKYLGVTRYGYDAAGAITLSGSDFYQLILLVIIRNNSGTSLYQIQQLLYNFFHGAILTYDYQNMQMSYVVNTSILSGPLLSCFISQQLLPRPMGVLLSSVIGGPAPSTFFSFRTYVQPSVGSGFNTYDSYSLSSPFVTYGDIIV